MVERVKVEKSKKPAPKQDVDEDVEFDRRAAGAGESWEDFMAGLEKGLAIDEHALNEGVVAQPELFYKVSQQLALQISLRDDAKHSLEVVEAEVDQTIRLVHRKEETKVTENEIRANVATHRDTLAAVKELSKYNRRVGELSALKEAFNQRNFMLKGLIDLYIGNYYGNVESHGSGGSRTNNLRRAEYGEDRAALNKVRKGERGTE